MIHKNMDNSLYVNINLTMYVETYMRYMYFFQHLIALRYVRIQTWTWRNTEAFKLYILICLAVPQRGLRLFIKWFLLTVWIVTVKY